MVYSTQNITAIILAGGQGKRLNHQNKGLLGLNSHLTPNREVSGETFISHLLKKLSVQSQKQIISANNDIEAYETYNKTVVHDQTNSYEGPLAGILSCKAHVDTSLILTTPCDSPMIPDDLSQRLLDTYNQYPSAKICVAHDGERQQNLFMLFDAALLDDMTVYFDDNQRKVYGWINRHEHKRVDFSDSASNFLNVNDENQLKMLRLMIKKKQVKL